MLAQKAFAPLPSLQPLSPPTLLLRGRSRGAGGKGLPSLDTPGTPGGEWRISPLSSHPSPAPSAKGAEAQ